MVSRTEAEGRAGATGPDFADEARQGEPDCGTRGRRRRRGAGERRRQDAEAWKGGLSALRVRGAWARRGMRPSSSHLRAWHPRAIVVRTRRPRTFAASRARRSRTMAALRTPPGPGPPAPEPPPPPTGDPRVRPPPRCRVAFVPLPRGHRPRDPIPRPLPAPAPPLRRLGPDSDFLAKNTLVYAHFTAKTA